MASNRLEVSGSNTSPADNGSAKGRKPAVTEALILDAARDLMAEGGVAALSMRIVAQRAGLSATAIYHYFENKEELVNRVVMGGYVKFGRYVERVLEEHAAGSKERLHALGEAYLRFALENREHFRVLFNIQNPSPREIADLPSGGGYDLLRRCVVDAMESGSIRSADPDLVAHYLWSLVHGLVTLRLACNLHGAECCPSPDADPESLVSMFRQFMPFVDRGICPLNEEDCQDTGVSINGKKVGQFDE